MYEYYLKILFKEVRRVGKRKLIIPKPPYIKPTHIIMYVKE